MPDIITANLVAEVAAQKDTLGAVMVTVSTTTALTSVTNAINTTGKYKGKLVYNDTTGILVCASDSLAASPWKISGTGVSTHTPV